jgi:aminoglycoside/choline kinase family phosphotransferase
MNSGKTSAADREGRAKTACKDILGGEPRTFESALAVLASPAWRGVEGDVWRAATSEASVIVKHYHPDTQAYVNIASAIEAATTAGHNGVGPKVLFSEVDGGILVLEDLAEPWSAGGLHHAVDPAIRSNVIASKKSFQAGPALSRSASIFDEIDAMYAQVEAQGIRTHRDVTIFKSFLDDARARIASLGQDSRPCHRDGNTANLMVHSDKSVKLIDFDLAANCDPFEDIGCYLVEFFENDIDARTGFEEWLGYFHEGQFQRAMLYGLADDMRWGLIGSIMAATSPRSHLEFGKYASWRFLRLEMHAKRSDANDRIRAAA